MGLGKKKSKSPAKEEASGGKKPVAQEREKNIEVAMWDNPKGHTFSINKSYKDGKGDYQNMRMTLFPSEIHRLYNVLVAISENEIVEPILDEAEESESSVASNDSDSQNSSADSKIVMRIIYGKRREELDGATSWMDIVEEWFNVTGDRTQDNKDMLEEITNHLLDDEEIFEPVLGQLILLNPEDFVKSELDNPKKQTGERQELDKKALKGKKLFDELDSDKQLSLLNNAPLFSLAKLIQSIRNHMGIDQDEAEKIARYAKWESEKNDR
jgi:hypothetical protein